VDDLKICDPSGSVAAKKMILSFFFSCGSVPYENSSSLI